MSSVFVRAYVAPSPQATMHARNGFYPDARYQHLITRQGNHLALCRVKQYASFGCDLENVPGGESDGNTKTRWRFAFHSSPFARFVWVNFVLATNANSYNPGARLLVETTAPATFGTADWSYGNSISSAVDVPDNFGVGRTTLVSAGSALLITPDTDFYGSFQELGSGRLVAANAYEWGLPPDTDNGYLEETYAAGTPIFDRDRGDLIAMARDLWKRQAGPLWSWSSDEDDVSPTSIIDTGQNVFDNSTTTVSASTIGATLDLRNRSTQRRGTVPCVFQAYGVSNAVTPGAVELKDSTGAVLATVTGFTGTEGWHSTTVNLPATLAKYDVHYRTGTGTLGSSITLRAFSLYQYEA